MRIDNPIAQEGNITGSFTGSFDGIGSGSFSGSYEGSVRSIDAVATGSFSGSLRSDDALLTGSYTGSFKGDGTEVLNIISASYSVSSSLAADAISSSYALSSSYATSALSSSHALNADDAISSSYAVSASYVDGASIATNLADNRVITATATDKFNGETNLTFDGSTLTVTGNTIITGDLSVTGTRTELQVSTLNVEDLNITVASGSATAAAANGAGLTIAGANVTFNWDNANSRMDLSSDLQIDGGDLYVNNLHAASGTNITVDSAHTLTLAKDKFVIGSTAVTTTAAELNLLDTAVAGTVVNSKAVIYGAAGEVNATTLQIGGTSIDSTAAELNLVDGSSAGTIVNSKAVIYGAAGEVNATKLQVGGVDITSTPAELNLLDGVTGLVQADFTKLAAIDASATEINQLDGNTVGGTTAGDIVTIDGTQTLTNKTIAASQVTEISNLTAAEGAQLENIGTTTISATQWGYLGATSTFGGSLIDDADAATARTTLGLGTVATLNSIDISDNTNFAVSDTTGQTGINLTLTDDTVSGVVVGLGTSNNVQFNSLGIGTAGSGTAGEIRATGDITAYYSSDERLKENFKTLDGALDKVNQLNGYEFDWKEGIEDVVSKKGHDIGVKAQEVQALYPELVHERDNGYLAVDYVKLTAVLLHAVKELSAKVDELSK